MRNLLDKIPGHKTITLIFILLVINLLETAGMVTGQVVADLSGLLYIAIAGTAYLGLTRK